QSNREDRKASAQAGVDYYLLAKTGFAAAGDKKSEAVAADYAGWLMHGLALLETGEARRPLLTRAIEYYSEALALHQADSDSEGAAKTTQGN
ncbi:hypothetical protein, partial [Enterococcus faecium]